MKAVIVLALFVAAFGQNIPALNDIANLTSGTAVTGTLPITLLSNNFNPDVYKIWIPEGTQQITVYGAEVSGCDTALRTSFYNIPCSVNQAAAGSLCDSGEYADIESGSTIDIDLTDRSGAAAFRVGAYLFVSVFRFYAAENDETCTYTVTVTTTVEACPAGQVATPACMTPTVVPSNQTLAVNLEAQAGPYLWKTVLPTNVASVQFLLNSTEDSFYAYTRNFAAPTTSGTNAYDCYVSSSSNGDVQTLNGTCFTPRGGDFYILLDGMDTASTITGTITFNTCNSTSAGYKCGSTLNALSTDTPFPASVTVPGAVVGEESYIGYGAVYYYWDIPNQQDSLPVFSLNASGADGYIYTRRDGFPTAADSGEDFAAQHVALPGSLVLDQYDTRVPGRVYFAFLCSSTAPCTVTPTVSVSNPVTPTPAPTPAPVDGGEGSSASVLVASVFAFTVAALF